MKVLRENLRPPLKSIVHQTAGWEGTLGIGTGVAATPPHISLSEAHVLPVVFRHANVNGCPFPVSCNDEGLPRGFFNEFTTRGFRDICEKAVVCPILPSNSDTVMGLLLLGLNTRTPYNDNYRNFISLLNRQLATSLAKTLVFQQELDSGRKATARAAKAKKPNGRGIRLD